MISRRKVLRRLRETHVGLFAPREVFLIGVLPRRSEGSFANQSFNPRERLLPSTEGERIASDIQDPVEVSRVRPRLGEPHYFLGLFLGIVLLFV